MTRTLSKMDRIEQSHFTKRVRERLHPVFGKLDPNTLWEFLKAHCHVDGHPFVSSFCRVSRDGKRVWKIEVPGIGHFYALVWETKKGRVPMTVFVSGMTIRREGKDSVRLP
jgi:hypothetical protein